MKKSLLIILAFVLLVTAIVSSASLFTKASASDPLEVTISGGYLRGIPAGMNYRAFKAAFANTENWNWHIYPAGATGKYEFLTEDNTFPIYTGCTFKIERSFSNIESFEIVVLGDVNGDGIVDPTDYIALKAHIKKVDGASISGAFLKASDVNYDGKVSAADYLRIKRYLRGEYDLFSGAYESDPINTETTGNDSEDPWYSGWY